MPLFTLATLTPFLLLTLAGLWGGQWLWLGLGYITVLIFCLDRLIARQPRNADPEAEFPAADALLMTLAASHFTTLGLSLWAIVANPALSGAEAALLALLAALIYGQISHPVAHELIHRPARALRLTGRLIYTSILFGHHASAHLRVHHVHVGTRADPNSARWGEGFWRFLLRAWPGGFREGLAAETRLRAGRAPLWRHPYTLYLGGGCLLLLASGYFGGLTGVCALLFISAYAQIQIFLSDYVQHYGLRRAAGADGRTEPVGPRHSWNAPHWASSAMTLNAPRHSDHHVTPARPYPALQLDPSEMPTLPHSLPVMAVVALVPPLWRRIMDPRCAAWAGR